MLLFVEDHSFDQGTVPRDNVWLKLHQIASESKCWGALCAAECNAAGSRLLGLRGKEKWKGQIRNMHRHQEPVMHAYGMAVTEPHGPMH